MQPCMHVDRRPLCEYLYTSKHSTLTLHISLAVAAVPKLAVFSNLQFGGVGGGNAVSGLHAVTLLQLRQSAHQTSVGCIQRCYALLLHTQTHTHRCIWGRSIFTDIMNSFFLMCDVPSLSYITVELIQYFLISLREAYVRWEIRINILEKKLCWFVGKSGWFHYWVRRSIWEGCIISF